MAKGARGKPGPNGMAGRHGSFERAQGSPNAGRAPGGAGECGLLGGRQWAWQAVERHLKPSKRPPQFLCFKGPAGYTVPRTKIRDLRRPQSAQSSS